MSLFVLFRNNTDVGMNGTISTKLGCRGAYNIAMKLFKARKIGRYQYLIIRQDVDDDDPSILTNLFGELEALGPFPLIFTRH
jgi:hypothetical protein